MKPRVLLDVDGVIADIQGEFLRQLKEQLDISKKHSDIDEYEIKDALDLSPTQSAIVWRAVSQPSVAARLKPFKGAVDGVKSIMAVADVFFVTSPVKTSPTWTYDRSVWLQEYFGAVQAKRVAYTGEKYLVHGDFLVDDKPENLELWAKEDPRRTPILWDQPWNRGSKLQRLNDWGALLKVVKGWSKAA